jgi:glycerol-3-phosphate dehydrogenase (NAD(P)+)
MTRTDAPASIAIVGAGSWGTALAVHLGRRGNPVRLWARDADLADRIRTLGANPRYLPDVRFPAGVMATASATEALAGADLAIVAVPSRFLGQIASVVAPSVPRGVLVVSATKGIERRRTLRMSEVLGGALPGRPVAVLSGPSFAREVALGKPAALVVAAADADVAVRVQRELATPEFRLYTNRDVVGVEIAGALKNVIAIAAGLSDSLDLGDNARAALITRGLAEIVRLGVALGASPRTFAGLAGLGDLLLTCTGALSRNRSLGLAVGRGRSLEDVEGATPMVAEGVETVASALVLAGRVGVPMPICEAVSAVLFERRPAADALAALLAREPRPEEDPVVTVPSADALPARRT